LPAPFSYFQDRSKVDANWGDAGDKFGSPVAANEVLLVLTRSIIVALMVM
jgi:hypothetical protein